MVTLKNNSSAFAYEYADELFECSTILLVWRLKG